MNSSPNTERTRLARELHDGLAQELAAFGYRLDQVIGDENLGNSNRASLRELRLSLSSIINQVRDEIYELRSNKSKEFHQQQMAEHAIDKAVPLVNGHFKINLTVAEKQRVKKAARTAAEAAFVLLAGGSTANRNKNIRRYYLHKYLKYKIKYMHMKYEQF